MPRKHPYTEPVDVPEAAMMPCIVTARNTLHAGEGSYLEMSVRPS